MLSSMRYLGADGVDTVVSGPVALGHIHCWTTPEEVGEKQPLSDTNASLILVWDGRLDNREDLYARLHGRLPPLDGLTDARLVLRAYAQRGVRCLPLLLGPFALAMYDAAHREVVLACDPMGGRTIHYRLSDAALIVASEPSGVLAHPDVVARLDDAPMATFFGVNEIAGDATFFDSVRMLLPGHVLRVDQRRTRADAFWSFDPTKRIRYRDEAQYSEHYLELLQKSVECRLRTVGRAAVALSGGLDSAPVAALAARHSAARGQRMVAASWVFDRFAQCDERRYIAQLYRSCDLESVQVNCDTAWPLSDFESWPIHPCAPFQNPYRRLHENLYEALNRHRVRVLLSGLMGDHLFLGTERWLGDLLRARRFAEAVAHSRWYIAEKGWAAFVRQGVLRGLVPHSWHRRVRAGSDPEWLTPWARSLLVRNSNWPRDRSRAHRPQQYARVLELVSGLVYLERFFANRYRLELRYPFRDRRLVEYMLQLPTDQLYSRGVTRPVVRRALRGRVPQEILSRPDKTSFQSLYTFGLCQRECSRIDAWLRSTDRLWTRYVDRDWLFKKRECHGVRGYVYWLCISLEMWSRYTPVGSRIRASQTP